MIIRHFQKIINLVKICFDWVSTSWVLLKTEKPEPLIVSNFLLKKMYIFSKLSKQSSIIKHSSQIIHFLVVFVKLLIF